MPTKQPKKPSVKTETAGGKALGDPKAKAREKTLAGYAVGNSDGKPNKPKAPRKP